MPPESEGQPNFEETIEPVEVSSNQSTFEEAKETPERELTPEEIERVMEKVQDIDNPYLNFGYNAFEPYYSDNECPEGLFKSILKSGFLAMWGVGEKRPKVQDWPKYIRDSRELDRGPVFHFAKLGESRDVYGPAHGSGKLGQMRNISGSCFLSPGNIAVIFDLSKYKEIKDRKEFKSKTYKSKTYISRGGGTLEGYQLKYRVAPRFLKGIVLYSGRQKTHEEAQKELQVIKDQYEKMVQYNRYHGYTSKPFDMNKMLESIRGGQTENENYLPDVQKLFQSMIEVDKDRPDWLLPIYDIYGNLWWPKQMTYEEVKEFVAERERKKKEAEEENNKETDSGFPLSRE